MAQIERETEERRATKRDRAKQKREGSRRSTGTYQWSLDVWTRIVILTELLAGEGGALRVGLTRDGGALALGVYLGDDYATEYVRPNEDTASALEEIASVWLPPGRYEEYRARVEASYS